MDPTNNELPTPVNPVITPSSNNANAGAVNAPEMVQDSGMTNSSSPAMSPAENVASSPMADFAAPVPPTFNPATMATPDVDGVNFSATDPITMPEPVKEPDPVELELNAPFKAADPVPGSIGSAISVPDPMAQPEQMVADQTIGQESQPMMQPQPMANPMVVNTQTAPTKKKMGKTTLTLLCVLAGITIVALVAVLIMELNK